MYFTSQMFSLPNVTNLVLDARLESCLKRIGILAMGYTDSTELWCYIPDGGYYPIAEAERQALLELGLIVLDESYEESFYIPVHVLKLVYPDIKARLAAIATKPYCQREAFSAIYPYTLGKLNEKQVEEYRALLIDYSNAFKEAIEYRVDLALRLHHTAHQVKSKKELLGLIDELQLLAAEAMPVYVNYRWHEELVSKVPQGWHLAASDKELKVRGIKHHNCVGSYCRQINLNYSIDQDREARYDNYTLLLLSEETTAEFEVQRIEYKKAPTKVIATLVQHRGKYNVDADPHVFDEFLRELETLGSKAPHTLAQVSQR